MQTAIQEFLENISESEQQKAIDTVSAKLTQTTGVTEPGWLSYWAIRILFITNWDTDNWTITFYNETIDPTVDPTQIYIQYNQDYSY